VVNVEGNTRFLELKRKSNGTCESLRTQEKIFKSLCYQLKKHGKKVGNGESKKSREEKQKPFIFSKN
jgi:hypothetical protein